MRSFKTCGIGEIYHKLGHGAIFLADFYRNIAFLKHFGRTLFYYNVGFCTLLLANWITYEKIKWTDRNIF